LPREIKLISLSEDELKKALNLKHDTVILRIRDQDSYFGTSGVSKRQFIVEVSVLVKKQREKVKE